MCCYYKNKTNYSEAAAILPGVCVPGAFVPGACVPGACVPGECVPGACLRAHGSCL